MSDIECILNLFDSFNIRSIFMMRQQIDDRNLLNLLASFVIYHKEVKQISPVLVFLQVS